MAYRLTQNSEDAGDLVQKTLTRMVDRLGEIELWVQGQYELLSRWRILAECRYSDTDDSFQLYEYDRNEAKLTVEFTY